MNALYRMLRDQTGIWRGTIKAYVLARATGADPAEACAKACFGLGLAELGPGGVQAARDWVARFDRIAERAARPPKAAN